MRPTAHCSGSAIRAPKHVVKGAVLGRLPTRNIAQCSAAARNRRNYEPPLWDGEAGVTEDPSDRLGEVRDIVFVGTRGTNHL